MMTFGQVEMQKLRQDTCTLLFSPVIQGSGTPVLIERACNCSPFNCCRTSAQLGAFAPQPEHRLLPQSTCRTQHIYFFLRGSVISLPWGEGQEDVSYLQRVFWCIHSWPSPF